MYRELIEALVFVQIFFYRNMASKRQTSLQAFFEKKARVTPTTTDDSAELTPSQECVNGPNADDLFCYIC